MTMLQFFKKRSKLEVLNNKYKKLQKEAYRLSTVSRQESDKKQAEAEEVLHLIRTLENLSKTKVSASN